jgi:hypothetical protein
MHFTFADATAPVNAGVCDCGDGLHHDIQAGFLYDCPWYKSCAHKTGMIQVKRLLQRRIAYHNFYAVTLQEPRGHRCPAILLLKNNFGTDTGA